MTDGAAKLLLTALTLFAAPQESSTLLERVRQRALEDLAAAPNYVCIDSIQRWWRRQERAYRRLDRMRMERAHVDGADHFSRLGDPAFQAKAPSAIVGYGAAIRARSPCCG